MQGQDEDGFLEDTPDDLHNQPNDNDHTDDNTDNHPRAESHRLLLTADTVNHQALVVNITEVSHYRNTYCRIAATLERIAGRRACFGPVLIVKCRSSALPSGLPGSFREPRGRG